ncbi:IRG-type G domain-containing protein [Fusarium sp. Ph1]|nr:IRG-type G domain-containing protein [Fusarium sp. Ph1]
MSQSKSPSWSVGLHWDPAAGWGIAFSVLGATLLKVGMATAFAVVGAAGAVSLTGAMVWVISRELWAWAMSSSSEAVATAEKIQIDRQREGLDSDWTYVAICGPSGSGKSSLLNALRGFVNSDQDAARVGTTEATTEKQEYRAAACFDSLSLVDIPGAGTQRVPSEGYFTTNKLYCYDTILIICGERFGEIEISLVRASIVHQKRFAIVRSRSDETIRRVKEDRGIPRDEAKRSYIQDEVNAIVAELRRSSLPEENIAELLGFFILVNKNTLRTLTVTPPYDWPQQANRKEIHERRLL